MPASAKTISPLLFISPTEPPELREIGVTTLLPEEYGVDIYWESEMGKCGVQRKKFPDDFLASINDGRLNREYAMMKELDLAILLLEGKGQWTQDGRLVRPTNGKRWGWDIKQHRNYLASVQLRGVQVHSSSNTRDTVAFVDSMSVWTNKTDHHGLTTRPGPRGTDGSWGSVTNRDYQLHMLQGLPGVGVKQAEAILDQVGFPFNLKVTAEQLAEVTTTTNGKARRLGKVRADKIVKVFNGK